MRSTQRPDTLAQDQITPSSPISLATHRRSIHSGHELSIQHPGQNGNLPTAYPSAADLPQRRRPIHALCHERLCALAI